MRIRTRNFRSDTIGGGGGGAAASGSFLPSHSQVSRNVVSTAECGRGGADWEEAEEEEKEEEREECGKRRKRGKPREREEEVREEEAGEEEEREKEEAKEEGVGESQTVRWEEALYWMVARRVWPALREGMPRGCMGAEARESMLPCRFTPTWWSGRSKNSGEEDVSNSTARLLCC
ncbi:unnamed protein product [Closterium sp. NIES-54]